MAIGAEELREWIHGIDQDVAAIKQLVAGDGAAEARMLGAGALSYVVTKLDLIPDWEPVVGVLDDAMVLRVAISQAAEHDLGALPAPVLSSLGRLANQAEQVAELVGPELYPKLSRYVRDLAKKEVRHRLPATIVEDANVRNTLFREIDLELKDAPGEPVSDAEQVQRSVRNYLSLKLKSY